MHCFIVFSLKVGEDYRLPGGDNSVVLTVFGTVEGTPECVEIEIIDNDNAERLESITFHLQIINDSFVRRYSHKHIR